MRRYETPETHAYFDGNSYVCYNLDCFIDGANLKEIDRISHGISYTPILRCSRCGKTYFGILTSDHEAEEEITRYAEQEEARQEVQKELAIADAEEAYEANMKESEEEERAIMAEVEEHESQENGDIILPNLITV